MKRIVVFIQGGKSGEDNELGVVQISLDRYGNLFYFYIVISFKNKIVPFKYLILL